MAAETVRVMSLSLRDVSDSCVLSVDLNDAWWLAVKVVTVKPVSVMDPLTTLVPVSAAKVGAAVGFEPL